MSEREKGERSNRPVETLRDGSLKVSIFRNQGERGDSYSMVPGRIFTDEKNSVRETTSLGGSEPLRMAHLLTKGYERVAEFRQQAKERQARTPVRQRSDSGRER